MGICSKAREVICCNQMTDIPIMQDVDNNNSTESKEDKIYIMIIMMNILSLNFMSSNVNGFWKNLRY